MVTTPRTHPSAHTVGGAPSGRRSSRADGVFARPEVLAAKASGTSGQRRSHRPRSRGSVWLGQPR